jgi:probable HAF family extracellular repeat protein
MTQQSIARLTASAALTLFVALPAGAATITEFDVPGSDFTTPFAINSAGVITGFYGVGDKDASGFVRAADGTITSFSAKGSVVTTPFAINDDGRICGSATQKNRNHDHAFVRETDGTITVFDPPHALDSRCIGFDSNGNIIGTFSSEIRKARGFVRAPDGSFTIIDYPHSIVTAFYAVNAPGAISGERISRNLRKDSAFVLSPDGKFTLFNVPHAETEAQSINDRGTIAGDFYDTTDHGFLRATNGTITRFDPKNSVDTLVSGINARGMVIGTYQTADDILHAFVRKPGGMITSFDAPDAVYGTTPTGVNGTGVITGYYADTGRTASHGFIRTP